MKKSNHSKIKNTVILFELLTRQVAADTMKGVEKSPALAIIKEFFKPSSQVAKELIMYQSLINERFSSQNKAEYLINSVIRLRSKLNKAKLNEEKYAIIREVKEHYDLRTFFQTKLSDYKLYAATYRVLEGANVSNAVEVVNSRFTLIENLTRKNQHRVDLKESADEFLKQDEEVRLLAYKLMLDKFNEKYSGLTVKQKTILKEYINNISNNTNLRDYLIKESKQITSQLNKKIGTVKDQVTKIKLTEVANLLNKYEKIRSVKEENVLALLMYHELLKELKNA